MTSSSIASSWIRAILTHSCTLFLGCVTIQTAAACPPTQVGHKQAVCLTGYPGGANAVGYFVRVGDAVSIPLVAIGGTPPYSWTIWTPPPVPIGLGATKLGVPASLVMDSTLTENGYNYLSGKVSAQANETYAFKVRVTDSTSQSDEQWAILPVYPNGSPGPGGVSGCPTGLIIRAQFLTGTIRDTAGQAITGAKLTFTDNFSKNQGTVVTDANGNYTAALPCGGGGTLVPSLIGYTFSPPSRSYVHVTADQGFQDYVVTPAGAMVSISGSVRSQANVGIPGARIAFYNGGPTVFTNNAGYYTASVPSGYTGFGLPLLSGYLLTPETKSYSNLATDISSEDYIANASSAKGPLITATLSHTGSFLAGQPVAKYSVFVQNSPGGITGGIAVSGTVTVTEFTPPGMTLISMSGSGWNCVGPACTRTGVLPSGDYHPPIQVTVSLAANATATVTNRVMVSFNGSLAATAIDTASVLPAFSDVGPSDPLLPAIDLMRQYGITTGCLSSPPEYCASRPVTRGEMAVFIVRSIMGGDTFTYNPVPYFPDDVPSNHLYFKWIQKLRELGITSGYSATLYGVNDPITDEQMAVFVIRARFGSDVPFSFPSTPSFSDVSAGSIFFRWIQKLGQLGISTGCVGNAFCPGNYITRGTMAQWVMRGEFNQLLPSKTPAITMVSPAAASPGQTVRLILLGENTTWSNFGYSSVSAGAGITTANIYAANGELLSVEVAIAPDARRGPRSITVSSGGTEATLPNVFQVQ